MQVAAAPQFDDREPVPAFVGDPQQSRQQVLAQGAAGAVVHQRDVGGVEPASGVAQFAVDDALRGVPQVVVEDHRVHRGRRQLQDGGAALVGVQSGDDHHGQLDPVHAAHQLALRTPGRWPAWAWTRRLTRERPKARR